MKFLQPARYFLLLISAFLSVLSILTLTRLGERRGMVGWYAIYSIFMLIDSVVVLVCYFRLKQQSQRIFQVSMLILLLNMVLTIFDQIGVVDVIFIVLNLFALILLYMARKEIAPVK